MQGYSVGRIPIEQGGSIFIYVSTNWWFLSKLFNKIYKHRFKVILVLSEMQLGNDGFPSRCPVTAKELSHISYNVCVCSLLDFAKV